MHHVVVVGAGHIGSTTIAGLLGEAGDYRITVADQIRPERRGGAL